MYKTVVKSQLEQTYKRHKALQEFALGDAVCSRNRIRHKCTLHNLFNLCISRGFYIFKRFFRHNFVKLKFPSPFYLGFKNNFVGQFGKWFSILNKFFTFQKQYIKLVFWKLKSWSTWRNEIPVLHYTIKCVSKQKHKRTQI